MGSECFIFLLSVKAGAHGLKQLNKDKLKVELSESSRTCSSAGLFRALQEGSSPQSGPFSLSNPANTRSMEIPLLHFFLKSSLLHIDPPLSQGTASSKYPWYLMSVPPVSCSSLTLYSQHSQNSLGAVLQWFCSSKLLLVLLKNSCTVEKETLERLAQEL